MTTEEEVLALEARRVEATNAADAAALTEILHPAYTHIGGTGLIFDRTRYIQWVGELRREHRRSNLRVVDQGNVALLVGDLQNHLHREGAETQVVEAIVMETMVREEGKWRVLSFQITPKRDYL